MAEQVDRELACMGHAKARRSAAGPVEGMCSQHTANVQTPDRALTEDIQGSHRGHTGATQGPHRGHTGATW